MTASDRPRGEAPQFHIVAEPEGRWQLSGEVDFAVASDFAIAFAEVVATPGKCVVDVSGLTFIDVAGMRALAEVCGRPGVTVQLSGVPPTLRRFWVLARFDRVAPAVELVA
jgi:anti-anti-sigma factor